MNKIFLIGRLTKDPEIRVTSTGKKVAGFSMAISEGKNREGQEITQFFNCNAWERTAEILEMYVKKGHRVGIVGRLQNRSWDKPDGTKGYATDITVSELEILTTKMEAEQISSSSPAQSTAKPSKPNSDPANKKSNEKKESKDDEDGQLPEIDVDKLNIQMPF